MNNKQKKALLAKRNPVNQYQKVLEASQFTLEKQSETIKKAIELRLFNQQIITMLEKINTSGTLTSTINNMVKLAREFDNLAMEYGPFEKSAYIAAVLSQSEFGRDG